MDPTTTLKEILETAKAMEDHERTPGFTTHKSVLRELSSKILDLNHWLEHGGFLPAQWKRL
jgi:hypothetical protein